MNRKDFYKYINSQRIGDIIGQVTAIITKLLLLLFFALRVCGVINWPWYWILSPLLLPIVLVLICSLVVLFCELMKEEET